jgi:hypothetical protein
LNIIRYFRDDNNSTYFIVDCFHRGVCRGHHPLKSYRMWSEDKDRRGRCWCGTGVGEDAEGNI